MKTSYIKFYFLLLILILFGCGKEKEEIKLFPVKSGDSFQIVDREGKIIINPQFSEASIFREGLALVKSKVSSDDFKYGFVDEEGKFIIQPKYKQATVFSEGLAWVVEENGAPIAINKKGETKITLKNAEKVGIFKEGLAFFSVFNKDGKKEFGFIDNTGNIVIKPKFSAVGFFTEGLCAVENELGKIGYINKKGELIVNYQFDEAGEFINGRAITASGEKCGVIDTSGKYVINPQYDDIIYDKDFYIIKQNNRLGWCDKKGNIVINPQFKNALGFYDNELAPVQLLGSNLWGYIDKSGKLIINPQFDAALPFNNNMAMVISGKKIGFIDGKGLFKINPQFDDISKDYILNIFGKTEYSYVETDYFNAEIIADKINFQSPEGFSFPVKVKDVFAKNNVKTENLKTLSYYTEEWLVYKDKKINKYAYISLTINSMDLYKESNTTESWYSNYQLNLDAEIDWLRYTINLYNKVNEEAKIKEIIKTLEKNLKSAGFKKDYSANYFVQYSDKTNNYVVQISYDQYNYITIDIVNASNEIYEYDA